MGRSASSFAFGVRGVGCAASPLPARSPRISTLFAVLRFFGYSCNCFPFVDLGTLCAVRPRVTRYTIPVHKKAGTLSSLRVALVSDVHLGVSIDAKAASCNAKALQDLSPDLILIAGDLLDSGLPGGCDADKINLCFPGLHVPHRVYVCLSNHDVRSGVTTERPFVFSNAAGSPVLHDSAVHYPGFLYPDWQSRLWIFKTAGARALR